MALGRSVTQAQATLATLPESLREDVATAHRERVEELGAIATWVHVHQGGPAAGQRKHVLRLHVLERAGRAVLACSIALFGGVVEAVVQISARRDPAEFVGVERTETIAL